MIVTVRITLRVAVLMPVIVVMGAAQNKRAEKIHGQTHGGNDHRLLGVLTGDAQRLRRDHTEVAAFAGITHTFK